ncbi:MAG: hypothetical protein WCR80_06775 [Bacilli bacterium]|uniref:hypothetical protein n=1 Tax=Oceanotoga sp. TaxID=2108366 RepID=UPI00264AE3BE|nr:hypothetical protein [Oceanotoga sp.]MDN5343506.1 hypothetical protein [Oceanotoga sp.]
MEHEYLEIVSIFEDVFEDVFPDSVITKLIKIINIHSSVSDLMFERKLRRFLNEIDRIPQGEKGELINEIKSEKDLEDLGLKLLDIINESDDENKSTLIGRLFILLLEEKLNEKEFFRVSHLVNNSYYDDLFELKKFSNEGTILSNDSSVDKDILESLSNYGFIEIKGIDGGNVIDPNSGGTIYGINKYGIIVRDIL